MTRIRWHRVFHPLCGADPVTLARLVARCGLPGPGGAVPVALAFACGVLRLPFTLGEAAWTAVAQPGGPPPVFIVGYPRSGTTHLHNLMAASGRFATVPPVLAGMPWEARSLARVLRPFVNPYLPKTRLIDEVRLAPDLPTEDEVALANMCDLSYFQAIYFPRRLRRDYVRALTFAGVPPRRVAGRGRALARYVAAVRGRDGRAPLLKNPAYTAQLGWLRRLFPEARVVHIHRDPRAVLASNARALRIALRELALQRVPEDVDATVLEAYPQVMDRVLREARLFAPDRFAEVAFERLVDDPLGALGEVWDRLRLPERDASLDAIGRYLPSVAGHRVRSVADPAAPADLGERWQPYVERFGARPASSTSPPRPRAA